MFHASYDHDVTAARRRRFALASTCEAWLLPIFLAIAGCQPGAADRPAAPSLPEPRKELQIPGICGRITFSPDGSSLAGVSSTNGTVGVILDARAGKELLTLPEREVRIDCVAYSPDGKLLAWGLVGRSSLHFRGFSAPDNPKDLLLLTDSATGKTVRTFPNQLDAVSQVIFSPDGKLLASASEKTVRLWDVATGKELQLLQGHAQEVLDITFSPDGKRLASTGNDNTVRLWDVASGALLKTLTGPDTRVLFNLAFHPKELRQNKLSKSGIAVLLWIVP